MTSFKIEIKEITKNNSGNYDCKNCTITIDIGQAVTMTQDQLIHAYTNGDLARSKIVFPDKSTGQKTMQEQSEDMRKEFAEQSIGGHKHIIGIIPTKNIHKSGELIEQFDYRSQHKEAEAKYKRENIPLQGVSKALKFGDKTNDRTAWFRAFLYSFWHRGAHRYNTDLSNFFTEYINSYGGGDHFGLLSTTAFDVDSAGYIVNELCTKLAKIIAMKTPVKSEALEKELKELADPKIRARPGTYVRDAIARLGGFCLVIFSIGQKGRKHKRIKFAPHLEHCGTVVIVEQTEKYDDSGNSTWLGM